MVIIVLAVLVVLVEPIWLSCVFVWVSLCARLLKIMDELQEKVVEFMHIKEIHTFRKKNNKRTLASFY